MPSEGKPRHRVFARHHQPVPFEGVLASRCRFSFDTRGTAMGFASYIPVTMVHGRCLYICVLGCLSTFIRCDNVAQEGEHYAPGVDQLVIQVMKFVR